MKKKKKKRKDEMDAVRGVLFWSGMEASAQSSLLE
jgi:hypothetical protein